MRAWHVRPDSSKLAWERPAWTAWRLPLCLALWAAISIAGAGWAAWLHSRHEVPGGSHAFVAVLLALAAAAQGWLARRLWPSPPGAPRSFRGAARSLPARLSPDAVGGWRSFGVWLRPFILGVAAGYAMLLILGRGGGMLLVAGAVSWGTLLALPLAANPDTVDRLRGWCGRPRLRRPGAVAFWGVLALAALEGGLRLCGVLCGPRFLEPEQPIQVTYSRPSDFETASLGQSDRAALRVAVMGDYQMTGVEPDAIGAETGPGGAGAYAPAADRRAGAVADAVNWPRMGIESPFVDDELGSRAAPSLLASALPDLEIVAIGAPGARLRDFARSGLEEARAARPDLLLVFVSVGDDIVSESQRGDLFDWRSLATSRAVARLAGWAASAQGERPAPVGPLPPDRAGRWEDYVQACAPQLTACRKPVDAAMQQRWKSTFACFDELEQGCRAANIPLALVVAPSPVQTNRALLDAVCRRQGCARADIDLELPQRRIAVYASQHNVPALDLLPALMQSSDQAFAHQSRQWTDAGRSIVARALDGWLRSTFATVLSPVRSPVAAAWNPSDEDRLVAH